MSNNNSDSGNPISVALHKVFGPLVELSSKLPAPLAYGAATVICISVIALLGAKLPENVTWLIGIIIIACLVAFVFVDWDTRRQGAKTRQTPPRLAYFSIDSPENDEEIPLGESQSRILEGRFPIVADDPDLSKTAKVKIEVLKFPEGQSVPQNGEDRISTDRGIWRFESATFAGEGSYEIIATAELGGKSDWRKAKVKCIEKALAYEQSIEEDRRIRGIPSPVSPVPEDVSLPQLYQKLHQMQHRFFRFFPGDLERALEIVLNTLEVLDPVLLVFPNDLYLQNARAYTFKNYAMVMRNLNRPAESDRALAEAEKMFKAIRDQKPDDAGAWNGLGSIAALRGEFRGALQYIDTALEIVPDYEAAQQDRERVLARLKQLEERSVVSEG